MDEELLFWSQVQHILEDKSKEERKNINFRIISVCYNPFLYYFPHYFQEKMVVRAERNIVFKYFKLTCIYLVPFIKP